RSTAPRVRAPVPHSGRGRASYIRNSTHPRLGGGRNRMIHPSLRLARRLVLPALALALGAAYGAQAAAQDNDPGETAALSAEAVDQPEGWDSELRLTEPEDLDPDPHVLEINLEARVEELEILPETR